MATHVRSFDSVASSKPATGRTLEALTGPVARAAFALPFAVFGLFHFVNASAMAGMVPVPGGVFWVYFTGAALIAGAVGMLTGILGRLAAFGLAALLAVFVATMHLPGLFDPAMQQMATMSLLKDVSMIGGALAFAGLLGKRA